MIRLKRRNLAQCKWYLDKGSVMYADAGRSWAVEQLHCADCEFCNGLFLWSFTFPDLWGRRWDCVTASLMSVIVTGMLMFLQMFLFGHTVIEEEQGFDWNPLAAWLLSYNLSYSHVSFSCLFPLPSHPNIYCPVSCMVSFCDCWQVVFLSFFF